MCFTMGARRRKLNRELLGIDREEEKDEESFGFKGTVVVVVVVVVVVLPTLLSSLRHKILFNFVSGLNRFSLFFLCVYLHT